MTPSDYSLNPILFRTSMQIIYTLYYVNLYFLVIYNPP